MLCIVIKHIFLLNNVDICKIHGNIVNLFLLNTLIAYSGTFFFIFFSANARIIITSKIININISNLLLLLGLSTLSVNLYTVFEREDIKLSSNKNSDLIQ